MAPIESVANERERWARLGWHGIACDVPEDWCPGSLEGDYASGYLRVEDETSVRLELRWESAGRSVLPASALVDNFLKQTRKKLPRGAPEPAVDRGRAVKELAGLDHEAFTWRGGFNAHSVLLVEPDSRRVVHVRVFFGEADDAKGQARRIFGSLAVAPRGGMLEWAVFGLRFQMPERWRLEQSALQTGRLQFRFRSGSDELEVARQSLAEVTLRNATLDAWFQGLFAKSLRGFRTASRAAEYRGHPAMRCGGVLSLRARPLAVFRRRRIATGLAWHCPEADKVFAIRCDTETADDPLADRVADSIVCH